MFQKKWKYLGKCHWIFVLYINIHFSIMHIVKHHVIYKISKLDPIISILSKVIEEKPQQYPSIKWICQKMSTFYHFLANNFWTDWPKKMIKIYSESALDSSFNNIPKQYLHRLFSLRTNSVSGSFPEVQEYFFL